MDWQQAVSVIVQAYWLSLLLILLGFSFVLWGLISLRAFIPSWRRGHADHYNIAAVRSLIEAAFTADTLKRFCQDRTTFSPVLTQVAQEPSLAKLAEALIEHCQKKGLFEELLAEIRESNPKQYEYYHNNLYTGVTDPLSWRDIPLAAKWLRYGVMASGSVLVTVGLVSIMLSTVNLASPATLIGLSYMAEDWDPRTVDLRTASSSGIPVSAGSSLQFFDLWIAVPNDEPEYTVKAEIRRGEEVLGTTTPIPLIANTSHPGTARISDVTVKKYEHDPVDNAWRVEQEWKELDIVLVTERSGKAVASTTTRIRLAPNGTSLSIPVPLLSFASIVYSINSGPPLVLDLRDAEQVGINAIPGDTLRILEIWYNASDKSDETVVVEAHLSSGEYDEATARSTEVNTIQSGIHSLTGVSSLTWEIPDDKENLVLWLLRSGTRKKSVMYGLTIPLNGPGGGLIPAGEKPLAATLTGLRYLIHREVDPRLVDLRTASTSGIPVQAGQPLHFFDLWAWVPQGTPGDEIQVEVYANGQQIGYTEGQPVVPGTMQLGDTIVSNYVHTEFSDAWQIQDDWAELTIFLVTYSQGVKVGSTYTTIRLNPEGTAWLWDPPNLSFTSVVYSVNDGPSMVLDLRPRGSAGLNATQGDKVTLHEVWYHSNANSDSQVELEAYLKSQSSDGATHRIVLGDIHWGVNQLPGVSSLSWDVPHDEEALVLLLSRVGEDGYVIMQSLTLPFGAQESPGLVPDSEAVLWPFASTTFMDFESDKDLEDWSRDVRRSSDQAFSGNNALQVTVSVTDTSPFGAITFWQKKFKADGVVLHYYFPSAPGVEIGEMDFCIVPEWPCKYLDRTPDQWHTIVLDFSVWPEGVDPPFHERELSALGFQGQITAPGVTDPNSYTFYVDAVQVLDRETP